MNTILKPAHHARFSPAAHQLRTVRLYATQGGFGARNAATSRKAVTLLNDDGRVAWSDLSVKEKAARTTQQTLNLGMVLVGVVLTGSVGYLMFTEIFSPDSTVTHFNRAVDRVKSDPRCLELLGSSKKILAFGEPTWNRWARARPLAASIKTDGRGVEHMVMHFNVEGPLNRGTVLLHKTKRPSDSEFEYKYLALDVPGHSRIWLENADATDSSRKSKTKFFGVEWSR